MTTTLTRESAADTAYGRLTVAIQGLTCHGDSPSTISSLLESMPGVVRAYISSDTEMAYIEYRESEVTPQVLVAAMERAGLAVGEVTVRSAAPRATSAPGGELLTGSTQAEANFGGDEHACCGPSLHQHEAGAGEAKAAGAVGAATKRVSTDRPLWPLKVRLGLFLLAVVLVLGPALWLIRPMPSNAMGADLSVDMSMTGFTPPNFTLPASKPVSIQLNNVDSPFHGVVNGALHQFAIDALDIDVRLDGKQSTVITLPALEPGSYQFYCNVCCGGKENPNMRGTITVEGKEGVSQR